VPPLPGQKPHVDFDELADLSAGQDGVISHAQLRAMGTHRHDVDRHRVATRSRPRSADRRVTEPPGVRIHRRRGLERLVQWNAAPPRLRYEAVVLDQLDGRLGHDSFIASGRDADRDLDDHADGRAAVRLRRHQVYGTPCRTATQLARVPQRRGWPGSPHPCGPDCPLG
jgi:hypothetical protein